ncbi:MAG: PIN domain-containing protein [Deltaproteobacteria bacterium]|nr:PIN domain-containing protein [Deltaproteobacteria bacterium]
MKKYFIDSNLIVYANDCRDPEKQDKALELISKLMTSERGVVSTQVLQEFANAALLKLKQRHEVVIRQLSLLESFEVIQITPTMIRRAIEIRAAYAISFWDATIISAAENAGCDVIYSEDLNAGQYYSGIRLENPFC